MKQLLILIVMAAFITGCATSSSTPTRPVMPPTPPEFLVPTNEPGDRELSCSTIQDKILYSKVMIENINRVFNSKGPLLTNESTYTITNGVQIGSRGGAQSYSTTQTYGGGAVYVYSDLSLRAMKITEAQSKRQNELKYLLKSNGCAKYFKNSGSEDYSHLINEIEIDIRVSLQDYQRWNVAIDENKELLTRSDNRELHWIWSDNIRKFTRYRDDAKSTLDASTAIRDKLISDSKAVYSRTELEAAYMRAWFEENTKTNSK
jgi:hypothetical protein